jgi:hypothetical protein
MMAAKSPLIEPPITSARRPFAMPKKSKNPAAR